MLFIFLGDIYVLISLKKSITINNSFQMILDNSNHKSKKVGVLYKYSDINNEIMKACI